MGSGRGGSLREKNITTLRSPVSLHPSNLRGVGLTSCDSESTFMNFKEIHYVMYLRVERFSPKFSSAEEYH